MEAWWIAMTVLQKVFICIAIPSTLLMVIQFILTLVGMGEGAEAEVDGFDGDLDGDIEIDPDGDIPIEGADETFNFGLAFRLFTMRGMIAFLAVMGWVGYGLDDSLPGWAATLIAMVAGFVTMVVLALLFSLFEKLQANGNMDIRNALGTAGSVYLKIPAKREGTGKVNLVVQEKFSEFEAVTDEEEPIPYGAEVVVIGISGGDTLVVKRK